MINSDICGMVASYPSMITGLQANIASLNTMIDSLTTQQVALNAVVSAVSGEMDVNLEAKRVALSADYIYTGATYGVSDLTDWIIFTENVDSATINFVDKDTFEIDNDHESDFVDGTWCRVDCGVDGIKIRECDANSIFAAGVTTVTLDPDGDITANAEGVSTGTYKYLGIGWDNDTFVLEYVCEFAFVYDFLTLELSINGTYGINDMLSNLQNGVGLLTKNLNKYTGAISVLQRFCDGIFDFKCTEL